MSFITAIILFLGIYDYFKNQSETLLYCGVGLFAFACIIETIDSDIIRLWKRIKK